MFKYYKVKGSTEVAVTFKKHRFAATLVKESKKVKVSKPDFKDYDEVIAAFSKKTDFPKLQKEDLERFEEFNIVKCPIGRAIKFCRCKVVLLSDPYSFPELKDIFTHDQEAYKTFVYKYLNDEIERYKPEFKLRFKFQYKESNFTDEIRQLISEGKTLEALDLVENLNSDTVLLSARFNRLQKTYSIGLIDFYEYSRSCANINYNIIAVLEKMNIPSKLKLVKVSFAQSVLKRIGK